MKCPYCGRCDSRVIDSRPTEDFSTIRRRRECLGCHRRFTTYETVERTPLVVIKRNGSRQEFDRVKIINGLVRACEKRPVSLQQIERIAEAVEQELRGSLEGEVPSARVGELVISRLKGLDDVAYIRFASVYRSFKDIAAFMDELSRIMQERQQTQAQ